MPSTRRASLIAPLLVLVACSSTGGDTTGSGGHTSTTTAASICAADARVTPYADGLSGAATDGKVKVTFVHASPTPPEKGGNTWTIDVTDDLGQPIDGAMITLKP